MTPQLLAAEVERRLLVNYRADATVVGRLVPPPFRPQLVDGHAVVGICLIRLSRARPVRWPPALGLTSENAAHRIAVEWDTPSGPRHGVYTTRRDSNSVVNTLAGGRLFPGVHERATFAVHETPTTVAVSYRSRDGSVHVEAEAAIAERLGSELFADVAEASAFFRNGAVGYSPGRGPGMLDGLELRTDRWAVEPVRMVRAVSTYLDDPRRFPPGSIELDCGLVMRGVPVTWARASGPQAAEDEPEPESSDSPPWRTPLRNSL